MSNEIMTAAEARGISVAGAYTPGLEKTMGEFREAIHA